MLKNYKLKPPEIWDFTEQNEAWQLNKKDPDRLLYIEATGTGIGIKTGDLIISKHEDRIFKSIINYIEYTGKENFRLSMIFVEFIN